MKISTLKRTILGLFIGYIVTSVGAAFVIHGVRTDPGGELFPFFTWSLFSRNQNIRIDFIVEITNIDGKPVEPPRNILDAKDFLGYIHSPSIVFKAAQKFGRARGHTPSLKAAFESRFMGGHKVSYQIVRLEYHPVERWRTGGVVSRRIIGKYQSGSPK